MDVKWWPEGDTYFGDSCRETGAINLKYYIFNSVISTLLLTLVFVRNYRKSKQSESVTKTALPYKQVSLILCIADLTYCQYQMLWYFICFRC